MQEGLVLNGRFRLIAELGRGGMGSVWRAEDMALEAQAAVKLIDPSLLQTPEALARFKREAKAAAAIRSTHVVQILEYGVQQMPNGDALPYIAMELLKGESLAKRLERVGRLPPEEALPLLTHVARALSLAHASGIVHRDLKPDNVFLVREMDDDVGKVLDFGVARQLGALAKTGGLQTQSGAVLGTPFYMSPEQTVGLSVDARSDIWSFGVIAFECLTGVRPFEQESLGALFHAICVAEMPVPSSRASVPEGFDEWFARATARELPQRFQNVGEALAQLRKCCGRAVRRSLAASSLVRPGTGGQAVVDRRSAILATTPPPASQTISGLAPRRHWLVFALGLSAVAIVAMGAYAGWRWTRPSETATTPSLVPSVPAVAASPSPPTVEPEVLRAPMVQPTAAASVSAAPSALPPKAAAALAPKAKKTSSASAAEKKPPAVAPEVKPPQPPAVAVPPATPIKKKENVAGF
jgi:eukaryotic-like serine/threonine-protein kinase